MGISESQCIPQVLSAEEQGSWCVLTNSQEEAVSALRRRSVLYLISVYV